MYTTITYMNKIEYKQTIMTKNCSNCKKSQELENFIKDKKELKMCLNCRTKINNRKKLLKIKWSNEELNNKKRCKDCTRIKNLTEFTNNSVSCNNCKNIKSNRYKNTINNLQQEEIKENEKLCATCHKFKNISEFSSDKKCIQCSNYKKKYYQNKKEEIKNYNENNTINKKCSKCYTIKSIEKYKNGDKFTQLCKSCRNKEVQYAWDTKLCKLCKLFLNTRKKYRPYCFLCYCFLHPEEIISKRHCFKQNYINNKIKIDFPLIKFEYDKIIKGGCSKRRPDWFYDFGTHSLIIECDENQHQDTDNICENKRMMEIFQDLGDRPIIFLRFNPDNYFTKNKDKNISCFKEKNKKIHVDEYEFNRRYEILKSYINFFQYQIPKKEVSIIYLFYDNFDKYKKEKNSKWKCIEN